MKNQFVAELKADKKKAVILSLLLVVALVLAVRMVVLSGGKPARATGATAKVAPASQAPRPSAGDLAALAPGMPRPGSHHAKREEYLRTLDRTIERDLFEPSSMFFPPPRIQPEAPRKMAPAPTTRPAVTEEQIHRKFIEEQARMLQLHTTVLSDSPTAIINGRVLRIGDWISGFEVTAITATSCEVRKEDVTVELRMNE